MVSNWSDTDSLTAVFVAVSCELCATKKQEKVEQSMLSLTHVACAGRSYCDVQIKHSPHCRQELHICRIIYCFESLLTINFYIRCYEGSMHEVSTVLQLLTCKDVS